MHDRLPTIHHDFIAFTYKGQRYERTDVSVSELANPHMFAPSFVPIRKGIDNLLYILSANYLISIDELQ